MDAGALTVDAANAYIQEVLAHPGGSIEVCWLPGIEDSREDWEDTTVLMTRSCLEINLFTPVALSFQQMVRSC